MAEQQFNRAVNYDGGFAGCFAGAIDLSVPVLIGN